MRGVDGSLKSDGKPGPGQALEILANSRRYKIYALSYTNSSGNDTACLRPAFDHG